MEFLGILDFDLGAVVLTFGKFVWGQFSAYINASLLKIDIVILYQIRLCNMGFVVNDCNVH